MTNVAERSNVKALEKRAQRNAALCAEVLRGIMASPPGRQWMCQLLERCHIGQSTFSESHAIMSFHSGEQNIGLQLWADLQSLCPDQYILMMQEAHARAISDDLADRNLTVNLDNYDSTGATEPESEYTPA